MGHAVLGRAELGRAPAEAAKMSLDPIAGRDTVKGDGTAGDNDLSRLQRLAPARQLANEPRNAVKRAGAENIASDAAVDRDVVYD